MDKVLHSDASIDPQLYLRLRNDFINKNNCDFKIILPEFNTTIQTHKLVLARYSIFFDTFFRFNAFKCGTIRLYGVNDRNLNLIITSMYYIDVMEPYFVKLNLFDDRVYDLLVLSDYLQSGEIYEFLLSHLLERLSVSSFSKLINFYRIHDKTSMIDSIVEFLISNFESVFGDKSILSEVPLDIFSKVCGSDELSCRESFICWCILEWLKSSIINDEQKIEILSTIRYAWVSKEFLVECLEKFKDDKIISEFIIQAIAYHDLSFNDQNLVEPGIYNRPRQGRIKIYRFPLDMSFKTSSSESFSSERTAISPDVVAYNPDHQNSISQFMNNPVVLEYSSDGEYLPSHAASHMWTWHNNHLSRMNSALEAVSDEEQTNEDGTQIIFINGRPYILLGFPTISNNRIRYF